MMTRLISFMKPLWSALKRDVSPPSPIVSPHSIVPTNHLPPSLSVIPAALVKPNSGPRSWSKAVRRRTSTAFTPTINQIADPEPGSFQHKAHVGINEKGDMVSEGEVDRRWSSFLDEPVRPKVSSIDPSLIHRLRFDLVSFPASTISHRPRLEKIEEVFARLTSIPTSSSIPLSAPFWTLCLRSGISMPLIGRADRYSQFYVLWRMELGPSPIR